MSLRQDECIGSGLLARRRRAVVFGVALMMASGCQRTQGDSAAEGPTASAQSSRAVGGEQPTPWPPKGAQPAPPPPQVQTLMERVAKAYNHRDKAQIRGYFINKIAFLQASDCDPKSIVDRVMEGAQMAADRADQAGQVDFKGFVHGQSYLMNIKRGQKPFECRARMDVALFQAKYDWIFAGKAEQGEAHFLRIGDVWFLVKL